ncbi:MAG TPA: cation transporter [Candidatus Saccharimonadia bacterium]|nr:cation transporter [Candidatus Saccharimonadia bacterium]
MNAVWRQLRQADAVTQVGLMFLVFAPIELFLGHFWLHNAAVTSDGIHNAFDGPTLLAASAIGRRLARTKHHGLHYHGQRGLKLAIYVVTLAFVGVAPLWEHTDTAGTAQLLVSLSAGLTGLAINAYGLWRTPRLERHEANRLHFTCDFGASLLVALGGLTAWLFNQPYLINLAAWLIFGLISLTVVPPIGKTIRELWQSRRHLQPLCPTANCSDSREVEM